MSDRPDSIFEVARRRVRIEDLAGTKVKLRKAGKELRGGCPICSSGVKSKSMPFAVDPARGSFKCYTCGEWGDVVDLAAHMRDLKPYEAAQWLLGGSWAQAAEIRRHDKDASAPTSSEKIAADMLATARPFAGTLGEKYLLWRGIPAEVVALAAPQLRYHPFAKWGWDSAARDWIKAPAIVLQVVTQDGPTGGVHATYLARTGGGKAALSPAKRMWGPQRDAAGRPGGAWLIGPDEPATDGLVVGEGVETTLSLVGLNLRRGLPLMRACAALSLNRLQGGVLRDAEGLADVFDPRPDPENPAFTWPSPSAAPWAGVLIPVDRDMNAVRIKARSGRGKPCWFELGGEARTRLSGRLAVANWKAAGAPSACAIAPPPGGDFNDELRRVMALGAA